MDSGEPEIQQAAAQLLLHYEVTVEPGVQVHALDCIAASLQWLKTSLQQLGNPVLQAAASAAAAEEGAASDTAELSQQLQRLLQQCGTAVDSLLRSSCWDCDEVPLQDIDTKQQQDQQQRSSAEAGKQQHESAKPATTATLKLAKQLQQLGAAVISRLPLQYCCNNPRCSNLGGLSEQELVAGKASRCAGCKVARYCSRQCQAEHWEAPAGHKAVCKRLRTAAAGAG